MPQILTKNYIQIIVMILGLSLITFFIGCPPTTESLNGTGMKVTAAELQLELEAIIARASLKIRDLEKQKELRDLLLRNIQIIIATGTVDPASVIATFLAFYGAGQVASKTKDKVKKVIKKPQ